MKKRILIVPHHPAQEHIKVRLVEIAKLLSKSYEIFLLDWSSVVGEYTLSKRIKATMQDLFTIPSLSEKDNLHIVKIPILHRPLFFIDHFNSFWLNKAINKYKFDVIINGSFYMFKVPKQKNFRYIYDVADYPFSGDTKFDQSIRRQLSTELEKADAITVSSNGLVEFIKQEYGKQAIQIANGAAIKNIRSTTAERIDEIKTRYKLQNKYVIGYIGLIGKWIDVDFTIKVFSSLKKKIPNLVLMFVGEVRTELPAHFKEDENIIFTGPQPLDCIHCFDLAILPSIKNTFQDMAFHIKLIEYSAARKMIIATPLEEVRILDFPNIIQADLNVEEWIKAVSAAREKKWRSEWDDKIEPYDWKEIINKLERIIEKA
ncbi:MAG: glycosyltransferase [bacterium]